MADPTPTSLYHYTCSHSALRIREQGWIKPACLLPHRSYDSLPLSYRAIAIAVGSMCWLTDLAPPTYRDALGLSSLILKCDRTESCFEVEPDWEGTRWWMRVRKQYPQLRELEEADGAMPMHWFVSDRPVLVRREITSVPVR